MKLADIWAIILIAMFIVSVLGVAVTGDARWLALAVIPGAVFAKWMRT
jgi:hypothetical protein